MQSPAIDTKNIADMIIFENRELILFMGCLINIIWITWWIMKNMHVSQYNIIKWYSSIYSIIIKIMKWAEIKSFDAVSSFSLLMKSIIFHSFVLTASISWSRRRVRLVHKINLRIMTLPRLISTWISLLLTINKCRNS